MLNPDKFAYHSGFDTFKQYIGTFTGSVVIGGTVSGSAGSNFRLFSTTVPIPLREFSAQIYMRSSAVSPERKYLAECLTVGQLVRSGTAPPVPPPAFYNLDLNFAFDPNLLVIDVIASNPYASTLTLVSETLTFDVKVFEVPF